MKNCILFFILILLVVSCKRKDVTSYDDVFELEGFGFDIQGNKLDENIRRQLKKDVRTFYFEKIDSTRYLLYTYGSPDEIYEVHQKLEDKIVFRSYFGQFEFQFNECKAMTNVIQKVFQNDSLGIEEINLFYNL